LETKTRWRFFFLIDKQEILHTPTSKKCKIRGREKQWGEEWGERCVQMIKKIKKTNKCLEKNKKETL